MTLTRDMMPRTRWFLDYDGSLCPHQEAWEERSYDPAEILDIVQALARATGGIFWNTGRRPESLGGVNPGFLAFPGYFIHGSCYRGADGRTEILGPEAPKELADDARAWIVGKDKLKLEIKPTSIRISSLEARPLSSLEAARAALAPTTPEAWDWVMGHRGVELLARGFDKAVALKRELSAHADAVPVAVGDDVLDRPAIEAALRAGGYAVIVGGSCGWITQIPHKAHQLVFCETPRDVLNLIEDLSR